VRSCRNASSTWVSLRGMSVPVSARSTVMVSPWRSRVRWIALGGGCDMPARSSIAARAGNLQRDLRGAAQVEAERGRDARAGDLVDAALEGGERDLAVVVR